MELYPITFPLTRQGVRNLDQVKGPFAPVSGGPVPASLRIPNVGENERAASTVMGGALIGMGLAHPSVSGALLAAVGAGLVYRGFSGQCELYRLMGVNTADRANAPTEMAYR
jgi:uncharacterized membrane protein